MLREYEQVQQQASSTNKLNGRAAEERQYTTRKHDGKRVPSLNNLTKTTFSDQVRQKRLVRIKGVPIS